MFCTSNEFLFTPCLRLAGVPPLTGTGTLFIHLNDQNDNVPMLEVNTVNMCLDTEPTVANITAVDLDLPPYSSPFNYELLGDVKDKWRVEPTHGNVTFYFTHPSTPYTIPHLMSCFNLENTSQKKNKL